MKVTLTIGLLLLPFLLMQASFADTTDAQKNQRLTKLFGQECNWTEVGDFGPGPTTHSKISEYNIDPSMAPIAGGGRCKRIRIMNSDTNNSKNLPIRQFYPENFLPVTLIFLLLGGLVVLMKAKRIRFSTAGDLGTETSLVESKNNYWAERATAAEASGYASDEQVERLLERR